MHCPGGNATDPIWRVLASSDGISSWTPLKPQHSNPNTKPNRLANQLWCIDFFTPPTPLIIPQRIPCLPWISYATQKLILDSCKMVEFESEIIKICQSSHKMYSNNILNFQESTTISNACTKTSGNLLNTPRMCVCVYVKKTHWVVNKIFGEVIKV